MIGRLHGIVIDCPDPSELASFYQQLLGMARVVDDADWVSIGDPANLAGHPFCLCRSRSAATERPSDVDGQVSSAASRVRIVAAGSSVAWW